MKILVVEDSRIDALLISRTLTKEGAEVTINPTGGKVLDQVAEFDLVILDINLPLKSGIEILKEIRTITQIPVIIFSSILKVKQSRDLCVSAYIKKPLRIRETEEIMRNLYRFWRMTE